MNPTVILGIDTRISEKTTVILTTGNVQFEKQVKSAHHHAQKILMLLKSLLVEHNLTFGDISEVTVVLGNGSFTGLRVGSAIANALAWSLGIPLNDDQRLISDIHYEER